MGIGKRTPRRRRASLTIALVAASATALLALQGSAGVAATRAAHAKPASVTTRSDAAVSKLDRRLRAQVASGSNALVTVYVTARGSGDAAVSLLSHSHRARTTKGALIVGRIPAQQLPKLAGSDGVVSVGQVVFSQTGRPLGSPEPSHGRPTEAGLRARIQAMRSDDVPYGDAPPLQKSHFQELAQLGVLDAKTHHFAEAWRAGFAGQGTTVAVLDGGTDFGHPDLVNTWRTGKDGWPEAQDPYGTLQWLEAPDQISSGLSWYVISTATSDLTPHGNMYQATFATRTGPSRNFNAPDGTKSHTYTFPKTCTVDGTVRFASHPDDYLLAAYGERPAILICDPNTAGVYDTVYVDLDDDYSFADEKPVTKASPASYRDMNGDGYTDLSGGLLYYISDGTGASGHPVPGGLAAFGVKIKGAPGQILAWSGDYDPGIEGHGTLTASNVVGQGVINQGAPQFDDIPTPDHRYPGAVIGGAPKAKLMPFGDIYFAFGFSNQLGYVLAGSGGANVTSNSYGDDTVDSDGFDAQSQEADIWNLTFGNTLSMFSTGNGAPGFGTVNTPSPYTGIKVGASTQFGGTGWDSIRRTSQIPDNDVMVWSDRGPGATGTSGTDIVADGAFSPGDATLNTVGDGRGAWETWGGTSRSTPVAAGAAALVYQAYKQSHGSYPDMFQAAKILRSSATDLGYDGFAQGSGSVNAYRAVLAATNKAPTISPSSWRPGAYRGTKYPVFPALLAPGASTTQHFSLSGGGTFSIGDRLLRKVATVDRTFVSKPESQESPPAFNAPDYLIDISKLVRQHADANIMVVRANYDFSQFDGNHDYASDQAWRLLTYDWTDINDDGKLWVDKNGDGIVKHKQLTATDIDGDPLLDPSRSEVEGGEYERFMYHRPGANTLMSFVRNPAQRMADGLFIGFQHNVHDAAIPRTAFKIEIDFYKNVDWSWVSHPATATTGFDATVHVPTGTPFGMYEGALMASQAGQSMVVPINVSVGAVMPQKADGSPSGSVTFGGVNQPNSIYSNGSVFGANDWTWRKESGDWRFFYLDVKKDPPAGSLFLTRTTWQDAAPYTDLDTLIFGPSANSYQLASGSDPVGAPYILATQGKSAEHYLGSGIWTFNTATGGADDLVTAPMQAGLQEVALHEVLFQGDKFDVPFTTTVGGGSVTPSAVEQSTSADTGSFDVTFQGSVPLDGLTAEGFGLSQPRTITETAHQDNPNDPSTASVKEDVSISHASRAVFTTTLAGNDLDLYVVYDANHDGHFTSDEIVASSATSSGNERVEMTAPPDGNYQIWVHGFSVTGTPTFPLGIDVTEGNDLTVSGLPTGGVPAGTPVTVHVTYSKAMTAGQDYEGELLLGPPSAPAAIHVPVLIHRTA